MLGCFGHEKEREMNGKRVSDGEVDCYFFLLRLKRGSGGDLGLQGGWLHIKVQAQMLWGVIKRLASLPSTVNSLNGLNKL